MSVVWVPQMKHTFVSRFSVLSIIDPSRFESSGEYCLRLFDDIIYNRFVFGAKIYSGTYLTKTAFDSFSVFRFLTVYTRIDN